MPRDLAGVNTMWGISLHLHFMFTSLNRYDILDPLPSRVLPFVFWNILIIRIFYNSHTKIMLATQTLVYSLIFGYIIFIRSHLDFESVSLNRDAVPSPPPKFYARQVFFGTISYYLLHLHVYHILVQVCIWIKGLNDSREMSLRSIVCDFRVSIRLWTMPRNQNSYYKHFIG